MNRKLCSTVTDQVGLSDHHSLLNETETNCCLLIAMHAESWCEMPLSHARGHSDSSEKNCKALGKDGCVWRTKMSVVTVEEAAGRARRQQKNARKVKGKGFG
jgi:hypothetical protein